MNLFLNSTTNFLLLIILIFKSNANSIDESELIFNITVPKDNKESVCIKMESSFSFSVNYLASEKNQTVNKTVNFSFEQIDFTFTGSCLDLINMVEFQFLDDWRLELYFKKENQTYSLNHVTLYYDFNHEIFPNSIEHGSHSEVYNEDFINATVNKSFKCDSGVLIDLHDVKLNLTNLHVQPFFYKPPNFPYSTEEICIGDKPSSGDKPLHIIVPVAIFCGVFFMIIVIATFYAVYIRRHKRNPYDRAAQDDK